MSSYPDNIEDCGVPGPSQSTLRVQYQEEYGVMPGPELDGELLNQYWEGYPPIQEGNGQSWPDNIDPRLLQQQEEYEGDDGPSQLIQRRPDLAPFVGSAVPEIYGDGYAMPQPGFAHGYVPAQSVMPVAPNQLAEHPFDPAAAGAMYGNAPVDGAAPVTDYGVPFVGDAGPVHGYGGPYVGAAGPIHGYGGPYVGGTAPTQDTGAHAMIKLPTPAEDDPFVTSASNSNSDSASAGSPATSTASSAQATATPAPVFALAPAPPQQAPQRARRGAKDVWTQDEMDRVVFMREVLGMKWEAIHKALGTHTVKSIADKYWQILRLRRGCAK